PPASRHRPANNPPQARDDASSLVASSHRRHTQATQPPYSRSHSSYQSFQSGRCAPCTDPGPTDLDDRQSYDKTTRRASLATSTSPLRAATHDGVSPVLPHSWHKHPGASSAHLAKRGN